MAPSHTFLLVYPRVQHEVPVFNTTHCSNVPEQPGSTGRTHGPLEKSVSNYVVYETSIVSLIAEGAAGGFTGWL